MVLRWSATRWRKMEALRDRISFGLGTQEPWFLDEEFLGASGGMVVAAHWRRPLSLSEVAQLAPTPEVRARPGRP
jgi:hypothetical protein